MESFIAKLSDEFLSGEIIYLLNEATILIAAGRRHYTAIRPFSALRRRLAAPAESVSSTEQLGGFSHRIQTQRFGSQQPPTFTLAFVIGGPTNETSIFGDHVH